MNSSEFTFIWVPIKVVCSVLAIHPALNLNIPEFAICPFSVFPFLQVMLIGSGFLVENIHAFQDGICFQKTEFFVFIFTSHCYKIFIEGRVSIRHSQDVVVTVVYWLGAFANCLIDCFLAGVIVLFISQKEFYFVFR